MKTENVYCSCMVKQSYTGENVLRQLQIIQIQHTQVKSSQQRYKKIELFSPSLQRHVPLKKSDFLGIFKKSSGSFTALKKVDKEKSSFSEQNSLFSS
jgi:hypothetical protein